MSAPRGSASPAKPTVLVVGQTPPPFHGQAMMLQRLLDSQPASVQLHHVRLAYSRTLDDVGRFHFRKVLHLLKVLLQVFWVRVRHRPRVLYYPPAGPHRIPMWRDIVFLVATRWMFAKTVFHMQASGISEVRRTLNPVTRWLFDRAYLYPDVLIRLAEHTPEDGVGLRAKQEFVVPNCVEDEWDRFVRFRDPLADPARLLYLGTVCEQKGVLDLLAACRELRDRGIAFQLDIVGGFQPAAFEPLVLARVREWQLGEHVRFHGERTGDAKFEALARAQVFCLPSYYPSEAFPCVLVEALSFGLPIVSTRWRGIPSLVEHDVEGFLVEIRDVTGLARSLGDLLSDPPLRVRMGQNGREKYLREYTTDRYAAMMDQILAQAAGNERPSSSPSKSAMSRTVEG